MTIRSLILATTCVLALSGAAAADLYPTPGAEFSAAVEGMVGFEFARFRTGSEQGFAVKGAADLELDLPLSRALDFSWAAAVAGEHEPSAEFAQGSTDVKVDLHVGSWARIVPRIHVQAGEGVGTAFDLIRFGPELSAEGELVSRTLFLDLGYGFDWDEIPSLPRHDRRHSAFLGVSLSFGGDVQFLSRMELRAEVLDSSDSAFSSETGVFTCFLSLSRMKGFHLSLFGQYSYEGLRGGGHSHSIVVVARLESPLTGHIWLVLEYEGMMEDSTNRDENFLSHRVSGGLKLEL